MSQDHRYGRGRSIHNPLPSSLASECEKASRILHSLIHPRAVTFDVELPRGILEMAKGLAIITSARVGFLGTARLGSGLIIARRPDGSWSAPCALITGGLGFGGLAGFELTDFVFVLTSDKAVRSLATYGSLTLGFNLSMAVGPVGRSAEIAVAVSNTGIATMLSYSKTRGLYGGVSSEGGMLAVRDRANKKLYGSDISAKELLCGDLPSPPEAASLMQVLNSVQYTESSVAPPVEPVAQSCPGEIVELSPQRPNEPPQAVSELNARDFSRRPELGTGAPNEVFELSGDEPQGASHELDSVVSPPSTLVTENTGETLASSVSPLPTSNIRHTAISESANTTRQ